MKIRIQTAMLPLLLFLIMTLLIITPAFSLTWSIYEKRMTSATVFDGAPAITQTKDVKIWVVWETEVLGHRALYYNVSSDYGISWSSENLTKIPSMDDNTDPTIFQISNGSIWTVFSALKYLPDYTVSATPNVMTIPKGSSDQSTITVTSLYDFSEAVSLSVRSKPVGVTTTFDPTPVTPPPNGAVNSILTISVGGEAIPGVYVLVVQGKTATQTKSVSIELEITSGGSGSGSGSATSSTAADPNYEIYYKLSNNEFTWSKEIALTQNSADDLAPSAIQASNGTIWVVWSSSRALNYEIYYKTSSNLGATWSNDIQLTSDASKDARPSIAQMKDGRIWVAWHSNRYGNNEIFYKIYNGNAWTSDTRLTDSTDQDASPALLQTVDSTIWVFYTTTGNSPSSTGDVYYQTSSDNGATWSASTQFTTDSNEDAWPAACQTRDTTIWVIWTSNRADQPDGNFDVWYRKSLAGDTNDDGIVNVVDLAIVAHAFGTKPGDSLWDPAADITKDSKVDIDDLVIVGRNYGNT